jgi:DNA-directed RNA polymerase subunit beta
MTDKGSFIINGAERVIVSQLHRSPGVFFAMSKHTNGTKLYSARIIPFKGSWIEFATDVNAVMYAYIDRKKKFPVTTLLRAIGYGTDKDILDLFGLSEEIEATKNALKKAVGRKLAARVLRTWTEDFVDEDTGEVVSIDRNEVLLERDHILTEEDINTILESGVKSVILHREDVNVADYTIIFNTLAKDNSNSEKEAVEQIYRQLRNTEAPDEQTARDIINSLFFSEKRYDLGEVGRYRINKKLGLDLSYDQRVLTKEDIILIVKYLIGLVNSKAVVDDIDHLSNRRVRTVGEQLYAQFGVGLARMARTIKERMNVRDNEDFKPVDLINARTLSSVINSFFGTNQLSQFMDQTNPLAEITHKRRVSALGPGGLSRERAGFEVRDVHYTHYGRLCTIETPEGPNIGLISSLCVHAKVNKMGFIETPYLKVENGKVKSKELVYLTAEEEDTHNIARANTRIKPNGELAEEKVKVRYEGDFPMVDPKEVHYMDVAPNQIVSIAASLIPFLEHDDANRALMGSNMQRQAVPLMRPEAPIVGTGLEERVALDSRALIIAEGEGTVEYVDARKIVIRYDLTEEQRLVNFDTEVKTYNLIKFRRTNQDTCINHMPIVRKGQRVTKGQPLVEGYATSKGELALGRNLLVAYMPWQGYNFEDAIVISERVVRDDIYTSIHIEEFELEVRDTKRGEEELTSEIPNVSEEAVKHLDENGIIRVGAEVKEGDILVGKITPKGESDPTPEEKLLRAIFGDKAGDVKDASLKAPPSLRGVVVDTKLFSRPKRDKDIRNRSKKELDALKARYSKQLSELRADAIKKLTTLLAGKTSNGVYHKFGDELIAKGVKFSAKVIEANLFPEKNIYRDESNYAVPEEVNLIADVSLDNWTTDEHTNELVAQLVKNYLLKRNTYSGEFKRERFTLEVGDELPTGIVQLAKVYIAKKRKLKVGDKMAGRHGNKGVVAKIVREEDMPFLEDGTPVDICLNPLGVPSRMNLGQLYEAALGWAGYKLGRRYATPIFDGATLEEVQQELREAGLPESGRTYLYDGLTGERFEQPVTVGVAYMLKLGHLVDDKMHARSIGPYSLITQQPLGGKAQFGGQRFGEMEVWALEAFGAAHILQEILTVKSDDVIGRAKAYEAIVKGENMRKPNIPESFNVLVHELRGLALEITME